MLPDWVSNPGPLTYESGALPIALRGPAKTWLKRNRFAPGNEIHMLHSLLVFGLQTSNLVFFRPLTSILDFNTGSCG